MKAHDKLLDAILNEYQIVRFTETNYIFEDGSKITRQKFRDDIFPKHTGKVDADIYKKDPEFYELLGSKNSESRRKIKARFFEDLEEIVNQSSSSNVNSISDEIAEKQKIISESLVEIDSAEVVKKSSIVSV